MALSKEEAKELAEQLKVIEKLSASLNKNINTTNLKDLEKNAGVIKHLFESLNEEWDEITADISAAAIGFKQITQEVTNQNIGIRDSVKGYNKLSSISEKIQFHQRGISDLSTKEIKKLTEQVKKEKVRLENAQELLKTKAKDFEADRISNLSLQNNLKAQIDKLNKKKDITEKDLKLADELDAKLKKSLKAYEKINENISKNAAALTQNAAIIADEDELFKGLVLTLQRVGDEVAEIDSLLGLGGAAAQGLSSALSGLGFSELATKLGIDEANEKMKELAEEIRKADGDTNTFANKFKVLKAGIGSMGKSLMENLKDPLAVSTFFVDQLISAFTVLDDSAGKLAKNFGISYKSALGISDSLNTAANKSYLLNVTTAGLTEAFIELNNQFGTFANISEEALTSYTRLTQEAGVTSEAAKALFSTTVLTGKEVEASTSEFLGQAAALAASKGLALNEKQILEDIQHISKATLLTLGGQPEELAKAVVESKALGVSLEKVEAIAGSLLQFEDSISAELEAELLTGKELNLEKARLAALNGDIATVASEIAKQTGTAADFTKMNVIQQEALAKSVGMTREDLAQSLLEREAMARLSGVEGKSAKEKFDNLVKEVGLEEAKKRLGDENLANLYSGQNIQERFAASMEKLKEVFVSLAEPLMPVLDVFMGIFDVIAPIVGVLGQMVKWTVQLGKYLLPIYGIYKGIQIIQTSTLAVNRANYALKALQLGQESFISREKKVQGIMEKQSLGTRVVYNAQLLLSLIKEQGITGLKTYALTLDEKSLAKKVIMASFSAAEFVREKITLGWKRTRNLLEVGYNALKLQGATISKTELIRNIGTAAMSAISSLSKIPVIGWALGLAAAGVSVALGYKFLKGNDVMSAGKGSNGYGKRTLLAPEGAIALNDKDTVIAGTDLEGKGKGKGKQQAQQSSSPSINLQPMIDKLSAVENVLNQILNKNSDVYMDSTKVGTALNIGSVQIQ